MVSPAARRWGLAAIVGIGLAAFGVFWLATPACACTPLVRDEQAEAAVGRTARELAIAQERLFARRGRYAIDSSELAEVLLVPPAAVTAEQRAWRLTLERADSTGRTCLIAGGRTTSDSVLPFTLRCAKP